MDTLRTNVSRRSFIEATSVVAGAIALGALASPDVARAATKTSGIALADLPKGEAPQPLSLPHFPDRLHAFVWRNWPLVPAEPMARVVGANTSEILRMGHAMGLSGSPRIAPQQRARSYITVIKRNWHLLPYEQLLELLDWTAEKLAYTLREDDFLFVKLGNLKPQCKPLRYQSPGQSILDQERAIARVIREEFPPGEVVAGEPLFGFIEKLSSKPN